MKKPLTRYRKAQLFDLIAERVVSIKFAYPCGRVAIASKEPEVMADLLERVLTVLGTESPHAA